MTLRSRLQALAEALPPGATVGLSCESLRALLEETQEEGAAPDELLTLEEVGKRVGRSISTVRTWCNSGQLPGAFRLNGREWRVPEASFDAFLDAQQDGGGKDTRISALSEDNDLGSWRALRASQSQGGARPRRNPR